MDVEGTGMLQSPLFLSTVIFLLGFYLLRPQMHMHTNVPAIISPSAYVPGPLAHFFAAFRFIRGAPEALARGHKQYPNGVFRVPLLFVSRGWMFLANGRGRVQEIIAAPEDVLSFEAAAGGVENMLSGGQAAQFNYTLGRAITENQYHAAATRNGLTRNLEKCYPDVHDEMVRAFGDAIQLPDSEWQLFSVEEIILQVTARSANRIFVGVDFCRNQEYLNLVIKFASSVIVRGMFINMLPDFLQPCELRPLRDRRSTRRKILAFIGETLEHRLQMDREHGHGQEWEGRPNDLISWLLQSANNDEERTAPALAMRILVMNFAAIHTTTTSMTAVLYDLAARPELVPALREEVESVIQSDGWTKAAIGKMHKLDSFLRESQRLGPGLGPANLTRKVISKDGFTFSDGMFVPYGVFLAVPVVQHRDEGLPKYCEDPETFDAFRFSRQRDSGKVLFTDQAATTGPGYLLFGHGRHACPGRFFVIMTLKSMLAHILVNYDLKAEPRGRMHGENADDVYGMAINPRKYMNVWIRKRN
ncbi:hypothetical protein MKEN_01394900 [Mycena kentingensis (nom. inval.)]|nr:hypothetical protein MKEN_01394900 [Mycena kentingensis (nom. inval.)]